MPYFAGPNITVSIVRSEPLPGTAETPQLLEEAAGISYVLNNSQQPIFGYASSNFDAMLPGREVIQGNFLLNHTSAIQLLGVIDPMAVKGPREGSTSYAGFLSDPFDIHIKYKKHHTIIINYCYIFSAGQTIQISEQGIIDEYSFIGRSLSFEQKGGK